MTVWQLNLRSAPPSAAETCIMTTSGMNIIIVVNVLIILTTVVTCDEYAETDLRYNAPRFLPDGLIVLGGSATKRFVANWQVLITVATPTVIPGLRQKLARFKTIINNLRSVHEVANATSDDSNLRIAEIEDNNYLHSPISSAPGKERTT